MKKFPIILLISLILSSLCGTIASAEMITAMATEINPNCLAKTTSHARILGYNEAENTLSVELIMPEVFAKDEVESLRAGDAIYTNGQIITIQTVHCYDEYGYIVINEGKYQHAEGSVYLYEDYDGNYMPQQYGKHTWITLCKIECPVKDSLLFLDYIDEEATGDALTLPRVFTSEELKSKLLKEQNSDDYFVGLAINNVYVVFNSEGQLATIQRYFVSWQ